MCVCFSVVDIRPLNAREQRSNTLPIVTASQERKQVKLVRGVGPKAVCHEFHFDNVFNAYTSQEEVFSSTLKPIVTDVLRGFECTVFAYGQTVAIILSYLIYLYIYILF